MKPQSWNTYWSGLLAGLIAILAATPHVRAEEALQAKLVPGFHFFYSKQEMPFTELQQKSENIAQQIALTISKETQTEYYGAFTYLMENLEQSSAQNLKTRMGWPVRSAVAATGSYRSETLGDFKCVSKLFNGDQHQLHQAWLDLVEAAIRQGYQPTGEGRTLIKLHSRGYVAAELQLGVR